MYIALSCTFAQSNPVIQLSFVCANMHTMYVHNVWQVPELNLSA